MSPFPPRTTPEHPFFVYGRGWIPAGMLEIGDVLRSHDGQKLPVEAVTDSGEVTTVYNFRIAEYHTYFVGSAAWGFSLWVHNADYTSELSRNDPSTELNRNLGGAVGDEQDAHHIVPWQHRNHAVVQAAARGGFNINGAAN